MNLLSGLVFSSRWLQAPLYLGLILAQSVYVYRFMMELWHLVAKTTAIGETEIMLAVLGLIDVVMIANLLIMVIIGGYETFVSRLGNESHRDRPEWLGHVNASTMKIKLAMSLIGISSIHLLKTFININDITDRVVLWQIAIHVTFVLSAMAMAYTAKITNAVTLEGEQKKTMQTH